MQTLPVCTAIVAVNDQPVNSSQSGLSEPQFLSECSPRDKPWDIHRSDADAVGRIYQTEKEFHGLSGRISLCSGVLGFAWSPERDNPGVLCLKLKVARFCRVRHCPVCQWRRSLMWMARFFEALPRVIKAHPTARFVFLTLTRKNVAIEDLRVTLREMNKAWDRLAKRKQFGIVRGWIRATEVTRGDDGSAHPHFHVVLMVPSNYFTKNYITQAGWTQAWKEALRSDYDPIVDVRAVKGEILPALRETLKYSVKPSDMKADPGWFIELTRQVHKLRFFASGGVLKDILKDEETSDDLLLLGAGDHEKPSVFFDWSKPVRRYKRTL
jgi:hypothetical protein